MLNINKNGRWVSSGNLEFFSETGTEGGYWAFSSDDAYYKHFRDDLVDGNCPWGGECHTSRGGHHTHAKHEGLYILKNGDGLSILSEDYLPTPLVREDALQFSDWTLYEEGSRGLAVHNHPIVPPIPLELWGYLFMKELPGYLITDEFPFRDEEGWRASKTEDDDDNQD